MGSEGPKPVGPARYGLQWVQVGLYLHRSGRYILRTHNWEGPQGGKYSRWDIAEWKGGWNVDADSYGTLREAAAALDEEPHTNE